MAKYNQEYIEVKKIINDGEDISLLEYLQYLKNPKVQESLSVSIALLCHFMKKLYKNEGISDDQDDVFRGVYL